jgi:DNA-binding response OmpR family regulator
LVEDDENQRAVMRLAMERGGHVVVAAEDAAAAMAIAKSGATPIDLVVCDIVLPDMDGRDLIGWLKERHPGTPIVAVTAEEMGHIEEPIAVAWYGVGRVLGKPFNMADLATSIADLLDRASCRT